MKRLESRAVRRVATLGVLVVFLAAWKLYILIGSVSAFILPPPEKVVSSIADLLSDGAVWRHLRVTLTETLAGFVIATVAGVAVGTLLGKVEALERITRPYIVATQVIPKVALAPLFVLWFGFGLESKIFLAMLLAFFPIVTNTILGVKSVLEGQRDVMTSLNGTRMQNFRHLDLPSSLPHIIAGMEVGIVLAQIGAIVGEYLGGSQGLGFLAVQSLNQLDVGRLFGVIVVLTAMGYLLHSSVGLLRRVAIPWHESTQSTQRSDTVTA